jgi:hypothetical protein
MFMKFRQINIKMGWIKLQSHEEQVRFFVRVLVHMQNVAVVVENKVRNAGDQTSAVRTSD